MSKNPDPKLKYEVKFDPLLRRAKITTAYATVEMIEDSVSPSPEDVRISSMQLRYWRAIHAELMTHRVFSRNASSSRAIPVAKVLSQVWNDPAGPMYWGANQSGMQAAAELDGWRQTACRKLWKFAGRTMCCVAWVFIKLNLHKQVANRLLEPWQYINVLVTSTEWDNFFGLRCHKDAQPEFQHLASLMYKVQEMGTPQRLKYGEWHLPYITQNERYEYINPKYPNGIEILLKMSTARSARNSYMTQDKKNPEMKQDVDLHDRLVGSVPIHSSPAEHQATPLHPKNIGKYVAESYRISRSQPNGQMEQWSGNFRGWYQYRKDVEASLWSMKKR